MSKETLNNYLYEYIFKLRLKNAEYIAFQIMLSGFLWLVAHPYTGIYHDSIIYSLLAARWLSPEGYTKDLFFIFGSQDSFNLYTPIFATLASVVGLDCASRFVVILGGALWIVAFYSLAIKILKDFRPVSFILFSVSVAAWSYSPNFFTFQVNEPFATARVLAMPIALLGLSYLISSRYLVALILTLFSSVLHPLIGVWALILVLCSKLQPNVVAMGALMSFLTLIFIPLLFPIGVLAQMNPEWLEMVKYSSMDVFFNEIPSLSIERFVYCLLALYIGMKRGQLYMQDMYRVLALMLASLYLLSLVASYYFPVTIILQAQPWRVMWLAMSFGLLACVDGLWMVLQRGKAAWLLGCMLVLLIYAFESYQLYLLPVLAFAIAREEVLSRLLLAMTWFLKRRLMLAIVMCSLISMLIPRYLLDLEILGAAKPDISWLSVPFLVKGWFFEGGLGLGFLLLAIAIGMKTIRAIGWLFLLPLTYVAFVNWDQRTADRVSEESHYLSSNWMNPFTAYVNPGDVVVWPGSDLRVWFELGAANYATSTQAVGIVFSEHKAIEAKKRLIHLLAASVEYSDLKLIDADSIWDRYSSDLIKRGRDPRNLHEIHAFEISTEGATNLCMLEVIDWVVLNSKVIDKNPTNVVASYMDSKGKWLLVKCKV